MMMMFTNSINRPYFITSTECVYELNFSIYFKLQSSFTEHDHWGQSFATTRRNFTTRCVRLWRSSKWTEVLCNQQRERLNVTLFATESSVNNNGAWWMSWRTYGSSKRCYQYHLTKAAKLHFFRLQQPSLDIAPLFVTRICDGKSELLMSPESREYWVRVVLYRGTTAGFHCTCWTQ
jgi:hypothetical protein